MLSSQTLFEIEEPIVEADDEFAAFWTEYPRKKARGHALRMFRKARKTASFDEIMRGLRQYVLEIKKKRTEVEYIKHAGTWLNAECWADEPDTKAKPVVDHDAEYARQWLRQHGYPEEPPI